MFSMMEKYANQLEELVDERTEQLEEEKRKRINFCIRSFQSEYILSGFSHVQL